MAYAQAERQSVETIEKLVQMADIERARNGEVSDSTAIKLQNELNKFGVYVPMESNAGDFTIPSLGAGAWKDLGYKGWKYRVDAPEHGGDSKPHIHVKGKVGKKSNWSRKC